MMDSERFSSEQILLFERAKILGVRSGDEHRYTGVWVVVVGHRIYARSWNDKPTGWYRAFCSNPSGYVSIADREFPIVGKRVKSGRIQDEVTRALAAKYPTKASEKWITGFAEPNRKVNTLELIPA